MKKRFDGKLIGVYFICRWKQSTKTKKQKETK